MLKILHGGGQITVCQYVSICNTIKYSPDRLPAMRETQPEVAGRKFPENSQRVPETRATGSRFFGNPDARLPGTRCKFSGNPMHVFREPVARFSGKKRQTVFILPRKKQTDGTGLSGQDGDRRPQRSMHCRHTPTGGDASTSANLYIYI
jgi:hypothetical protein